ncbi:MAG: hypothetical protein NCW75_11780 [Phycisphaera sp.]|nr:MAG: hypothetical protein NCW75_11780 [Phycisphaera sp.]
MVIPVKKSEELAFFEQRAPIWEANAAQLNLSIERTAELTALTNAARAAYDQAQSLRSQAKAATSAQNQALTAMHNLGAELIKSIRTTAELENDPSLYGIAQIPEPKDPAPIPPVEASNLSFDLLNDGALELAWDGRVSTGTTYIVQRAITPAGGSQGTYQDLGFADEKRFVDTTIPAGTERASYVVRAKKGGTITAGTAPITVRFTIGGNGQAVAEAA